MIDGVTVNSDNLVINTGGGSVPSPPPSSLETNKSESAQTAEETSAKVDLRPEVATQETDKAVKEGSQEKLEDELKETIERLNDKLGRLDREILLKVDKRIGKNYVSVIDKESKEIIREFPPKEIRSFIARFMEFNENLASTTDLRSLIINLEV
jgi:flagellar protein FlaG